MNAMGRASTDEDRISTMARQMSRWVDQVLGKGFHCAADAWTPAINVYEGGSYYCVVVELAGMSPEKIDLRVENHTLTVSGDRLTPGLPEDETVNLLMMEIDHGSFCRTVKLPPDADANTVNASYRGGYLWIRLPKKA